MLVAADFREKARTALSGNWGVAIGTGFVASLLGAYTALQEGGGGSSNSSDSSSSFNSGDIDAFMQGINYSESSSEFNLVNVDIGAFSQSISNEVLVGMALGVGLIAIVALVIAIVRFVIGGPITLGYVKFNLDMVNGKRPKFADLFSQFHRLGEGFCVQFLRGLFIFLWGLLLIIPGIIAAYSYAMAPYILYENPGMPASEAISASKQMMKGNKWRLFCLNFSFIGWAILSVFTLGIGYLWLNPYMEASYAAFYEELKREQFVVPSYSSYSQDESVYDQYNY